MGIKYYVPETLETPRNFPELPPETGTALAWLPGMPVLIGTSGWLYRHWNGIFYPRGVPNRFLYYAERFQTVELNVTFYRLPERTVFENWESDRTAGFCLRVQSQPFPYAS